MLCTKMKHDLKHFKDLHHKHPTVFKLVRYEDFVLDINATIKAMYNHIEEEPPEVVYRTLNKMLFSGHRDPNVYSVWRKNATDSLLKWTKAYSQSEIQAVNMHCKAVLSELGYSVTDVSNNLSYIKTLTDFKYGYT